MLGGLYESHPPLRFAPWLRAPICRQSSPLLLGIVRGNKNCSFTFVSATSIHYGGGYEVYHMTIASVITLPSLNGLSTHVNL